MLMDNFKPDTTMAPYGFGTWITPQNGELSVASNAMSGAELLQWMRDPGSHMFALGQGDTTRVIWIQGIDSVHIPPGNVYTVLGGFTLAGLCCSTRMWRRGRRYSCNVPGLPGWMWRCMRPVCCVLLVLLMIGRKAWVA